MVFLTSHLPKRPSEGDTALRAAGPDAFWTAIEMLSEESLERLERYARGGIRPTPRRWDSGRRKTSHGEPRSDSFCCVRCGSRRSAAGVRRRGPGDTELGSRARDCIALTPGHELPGGLADALRHALRNEQWGEAVELWMLDHPEVDVYSSFALYTERDIELGAQELEFTPLFQE